MSTKNDITGDTIVSKATTTAYRTGWDRIFGWISVSDQLPSPGEDVLVRTQSGEEYVVYLCPCCLREWRCPITGSTVLLEVTHWRSI